MDKVLELVVAASVLTLAGAIVMFAVSSEAQLFENSSEDLVNDTACKEAQNMLEEGDITEQQIPERCKQDTGLERTPLQALPV
ncbi:MAG: hypothetical protein ABEJ93_01380 [Candidatus Nanohalobium sp.]